MTFDAGTWWLITIIVTTVVGLVGFLFGRSVFRQLDENRADIKQVRENYTPRDDHQKDLERLRTAHQKDVEALRREMTVSYTHLFRGKCYQEVLRDIADVLQIEKLANEAARMVAGIAADRSKRDVDA